MSYAGPATTRGTKRPEPPRRPSAEPNHETDWQQVAVFGAGLAVGLALGAGIALLSAPQPGWKTRADITRYTRTKRRALQRRSRDAWLDLRDELRDAARSLRHRKGRASGRSPAPGELHPDSDDR